MLKRLILSFFLAIFFLYFAFKSVDFDKVIPVFKKIDWKLIPLWFVFASISYFLRTFRWSVILLPLKKINLINLFYYLVIGFFCNIILPVRIGEVVRAYITGLKNNISKASVLGTVIVERVLDVFGFIFLGLISLFFLPTSEIFKKSLISVIVIFIIVVIIMFVMFYKKIPIKNFFLFRILPKKLKIVEFIENIIAGFKIISSPLHLLWIFFLTSILWLNETIIAMVLINACNVKIGFFGSMFVLVMILVGVSVPSGPGFVGGYEFFGISALKTLGIEPSVAAGVILFLHFIVFISTIILGILAIVNVGFSFKRIKEI